MEIALLKLLEQTCFSFSWYKICAMGGQLCVLKMNCNQHMHFLDVCINLLEQSNISHCMLQKLTVFARSHCKFLNVLDYLNAELAFNSSYCKQDELKYLCFIGLKHTQLFLDSVHFP